MELDHSFDNKTWLPRSKNMFMGEEYVAIKENKQSGGRKRCAFFIGYVFKIFKGTRYSQTKRTLSKEYWETHLMPFYVFSCILSFGHLDWNNFVSRSKKVSHVKWNSNDCDNCQIVGAILRGEYRHLRSLLSPEWNYIKFLMISFRYPNEALWPFLKEKCHHQAGFIWWVLMSSMTSKDQPASAKSKCFEGKK